ncbi:MAG: portal protein [Pikeienuella sp.]
MKWAAVAEIGWARDGSWSWIGEEMKNDKIIKAALDRMEEAVDADRENREEALNDLQNLAGFGQWPDSVKSEREGTNRPCLTINRLPQFVRQVTGDIRNLNPSINVMPADDEATTEVAEIIEGMTRQIQYRSDASSVYEAAAESAAQCGMGFFRVRADFEDEASFNQEILIERIHNPFSVYFDPAARMPTREDAGWCFVTESMSKADFEAAYPGKAVCDVSVDAQTDGLENWMDEGSVVVAEYFWKEPVEKKIGMLRDGTIVADPKAPMDIIRERKVQSHKIMWAKVSGKEVLEEPKEFPCSYLPVIAVVGEEMTVGDKIVRSSVIRYAKDPQRLYNYWRSAQTEMIALQPKAPYLVTTKQVKGLETFWKEANTSNRAYLPYHPDEKAGAPQRATPPVPSQGMMQEIVAAADDMKATTGIYDAGLGQRSNEQSGVAIRQRQLESDISTSIYADNLSKAVALCGRIVVEMIPKIYDTNRIVRTVGKDDAENMVPVNGIQVSQDGISPVNNLMSGKYDVRVSVGPSYTTKRQEAAESMIDFVRAFPAAAQVAGDLVAKNMDWPGAEEFADRLKKLLPPGVIPIGDMEPEEQQAAMAAQQQQQQRDAMMEQGQMASIQKEVAESEEAQADAEKARLEVAEKSLELAIASGQLDAAINQAVARALQGAMVPQGIPGQVPL